MKKFAFISLLMFLFIGCQSSSQKNIENSHQLNPKVLISDANLTSNVLKGKLKLIETNDFYSNVVFDKITINSNKCEIKNLNLDKNTLKNGEIVNFEANVSCAYIDNLNVSFEEEAHYMDTSLKTLKKEESKTYVLNAGNKELKSQIELGIVTIQPSSQTVNTGGSYTFKVYTFDKSNNPVSVPVKIDPPVSGGKLIGEFDKYSLTTDAKGEGEFTYTAPDVISSDSLEFNVTVTVNNDVNRIVNITVQKNKEIVIKPTKLLLVPDKITLSGGASQKITIFTLDANNRGVSSTVILSHPIDKKNESWGTFDKYKLVTNENGEGSVTFTAINDVQSLKEDNLKVPIVVQSIGLEQNLSLEKPKLSEETNSTSYKIDYIIANSVAVNSKFDLIVKILNSISNELINSDNVNELNLTSENHLVYFDNNTSKFSKTFNKLNPISLQPKSSIVSGIDIIDVNASVEDGNISKNISAQIPVVITSGPVSAISINTIGSNYNSDTGLFEQIYSIHAVDKYSNPVKKGTKIKVGAVVNYKKVSNKGKLLANSDKFKDTTQNFNNDLLNNTLIVIPDTIHNNPLYLGGWIIKNIIDTNTLQFASIFNGKSDVSNLSYVIGNEKRYISCESTLAVADFDSADKTYETDAHGNTKVVLRFDPYLLGKTVSLYVNSFQDVRVGISLKDLFDSNHMKFKESNEDGDVSPTDDIWERTSGKDTNQTGVIYVGMNGGPYNTIVGDGTTLLEQVPVQIKVLTPSVCKFADDGSIIKEVNTSCSGAVVFTAHYDNNGTCKVEFMNINYEY